MILPEDRPIATVAGLGNTRAAGAFDMSKDTRYNEQKDREDCMLLEMHCFGQEEFLVEYGCFDRSKVSDEVAYAAGIMRVLYSRVTTCLPESLG